MSATTDAMPMPILPAVEIRVSVMELETFALVRANGSSWMDSWRLGGIGVEEAGDDMCEDVFEDVGEAVGEGLREDSEMRAEVREAVEEAAALTSLKELDVGVSILSKISHNLKKYAYSSVSQLLEQGK